MEKLIKELIEELQENLYANVQILMEFPNYEVYGLKEIHANTKQSIRYIGKLHDEYLCMVCHEEHGDKPIVQYYKAQAHHDCFVERFGQEKFDRIKAAQDAFRAEYPEQADLRNP